MGNVQQKEKASARDTAGNFDAIEEEIWEH